MHSFIEFALVTMKPLLIKTNLLYRWVPFSIMQTSHGPAWFQTYMFSCKRFYFFAVCLNKHKITPKSKQRQVNTISSWFNSRIALFYLPDIIDKCWAKIVRWQMDITNEFAKRNISVYFVCISIERDECVTFRNWNQHMNFNSLHRNEPHLLCN